MLRDWSIAGNVPSLDLYCFLFVLVGAINKIVRHKLY